jgi:ATP-dependent Clp protease ATP-binding subunit ClpA
LPQFRPEFLNRIDEYVVLRSLAREHLKNISVLVTFDHAIDGVIQNNPKARANPKALAQ